MIEFVKYHGTGNDFILINGDLSRVNLKDADWIRRCCDRRFGIGGNGLIVVRAHDQTDFEMLYFNSDGRPGSFCGNGGRCAVIFALEEGLFTGKECIFSAYDGKHEARIDFSGGKVAIRMADVLSVETGENFAILDTGSPHYVEWVRDLDYMNITEAGRAIRYSPRFASEGVNVNFIEEKEDGFLKVATYERGVEEETLSCGTGVVASALASFYLRLPRGDVSQEINVHTRGGTLKVQFVWTEDRFHDIWLTGPVEFVFSGRLADHPPQIHS